jgi:hypothetical protein
MTGVGEGAVAQQEPQRSQQWIGGGALVDTRRQMIATIKARPEAAWKRSNFLEDRRRKLAKSLLQLWARLVCLTTGLRTARFSKRILFFFFLPARARYVREKTPILVVDYVRARDRQPLDELCEHQTSPP